MSAGSGIPALRPRRAEAWARAAARAARSETARLLPLLGLWLAVGAVRGGDRPLSGDEAPLLHYAGRLLDGGYATPGGPDATLFLWHGPGLPALLAPLVALGAPHAVLRLTGPLLLFAAIVLFYRLLRERLERRWALLGAWALGCYLPFAEVVGPLYKEPLALVLIVAAMLAATRGLAGGSRAQLVLAGLALAALTMTREEFGWVIVLLLVVAGCWSVVRRSAVAVRSLAICAVALLGCLPWLVYTHFLTGRLLYWGNAGGLSLYWMAPHPHQIGTWHAVHSVFSQPSLAPFRPFFRRLEQLPPLQRDLALQHAALHDIAGNPAGYAMNLLANAGRGFAVVPITSRVPVVAAALEALFSVGLLLAASASLLWWASRGRRRLPPETAPFALAALVGLAIHLPVSTEPRLLLSLVPVAIWFVVHAAAARAGGPPAVAPSRARWG